MSPRASLAFALLLACGVAGAQSITYKWVDADGKTQYSDKLPKDFKGAVIRMESDPSPPMPVPVPSKKVDVPKPPAEGAARDKSADFSVQRREKRLALEASVAKARENLEAARQAVASGGDPQADELQTVRSRPDNRGGRAGTQVARSNCRQAVGANGKLATYCPGVVPTAEFYDRIAQLEDAVRKAEEALAVAQEAYRRGAD